MGMYRMPPEYAEGFARDYVAGVDWPTIRARYPKADGKPYSDRAYMAWAADLKIAYQRSRRPYYQRGPEGDAAPPSTNAAIPPTAETPPSAETTPEAAVAAAVAAEQARQTTLAARTEERRLLREAATLDRILQVLREEMPRLQARPPRPLLPPPATDAPSEEVLAFISDVQLGERIERAPTSGLGFYNVAEFQRRAERYYHAVTQLIRMHRTAAPIRRLHAVFGGDIVEGSTIYPSQQAQIEVGAIQQVIVAVETFSDMLARFVEEGLDVIVYGVPGNHGRIGRKGETPYMVNLDHLVYHGMRWRLEQYPIAWHISEAWLQLVRIQGHLYAVEHGDMVRGSLSIPLYGLLRRHNRLVNTTGEIIEGLLIGHHHTPTQAEAGFGATVYINGCWPGASDYSVHQMGVGGLPSQLLLGITAKRGVTWSRWIELASADEMRQVPIVETAPG